MMSSARTNQRSNIEQRLLVNARPADRVVCFARLKERLPGPQLRLCVYNDGGRHTRRFGGSQALANTHSRSSLLFFLQKGKENSITKTSTRACDSLLEQDVVPIHVETHKSMECCTAAMQKNPQSDEVRSTQDTHRIPLKSTEVVLYENPYAAEIKI